MLTFGRILIVVCIFTMSILAGVKIGESAKIHNAEEYRVWIKMTGNPNSLTLQEFVTWKNL
jgi:hypothetical protein